ncbi:hypothetical protein [Pandoraea commovens]|uniref:Surface presentation of antigens protein SpaK n=1 Tax=Pandoraea commovens TaxID=2508289 RepID=A0A5E4W8F7_9BURK|nr:hypothetical protein [Pandoraea commovens]VVE20159.1 hypothetical protein PCO31010_03118 [Pandoraea commovens]
MNTSQDNHLVTRFREAMQGLLVDIGLSRPEVVDAFPAYELASDDGIKLTLSVDSEGVVTVQSHALALPDKCSTSILVSLLRQNRVGPSYPPIVTAIENTDEPGVVVCTQERLENLTKDHFLTLFQRLSDEARLIRQTLDSPLS